MHEFNFIVNNEYHRPDDADVFFDGEECELVPPGTDMFDILVRCGIFPSKSQARKDGRWPQEIPPGWNDYQGLGRWKKRITIFNPTKGNMQ